MNRRPYILVHNDKGHRTLIFLDLVNSFYEAPNAKGVMETFVAYQGMPKPVAETLEQVYVLIETAYNTRTL